MGWEARALVEDRSGIRFGAAGAAGAVGVWHLQGRGVADGDGAEWALQRVRDGLRHLGVDALSELAAAVHHMD